MAAAEGRKRANSTGKSLKLVEVPQSHGREHDKKWSFVDDDESQSQSAPMWMQGGTMYYPPPIVCFAARRPAGEVKGKKVEEIQLQAGVFMAKIYTLGATLAEMHIPDANGMPVDCVLGYPTMESYLKDSAYFGANVGRVANRIAGGKFTLDGEEHTLSQNDGENTLHGGEQGWSRAVWDVEYFDSTQSSVTLSLHSGDGDGGFPGEVHATISYYLNPAGVLRIEFGGDVSGRATPINLAHHSYWNLGGHQAGSDMCVLDHAICIDADAYTPVDTSLIPTGELRSVDDTAFDLRTAKLLRDAITANDGEGYDHNFALNKVVSPDAPDPTLHFVASIQDPSGRIMEVHTSEVGVQFYTGNFLDGVQGKHGAVYQKHAGLCLETQGFPNAMNQPEFPSVIVKPGEKYSHVVEHRFFC